MKNPKSQTKSTNTSSTEEKELEFTFMQGYDLGIKLYTADVIPEQEVAFSEGVETSNLQKSFAQGYFCGVNGCSEELLDAEYLIFRDTLETPDTEEEK